MSWYPPRPPNPGGGRLRASRRASPSGGLTRATATAATTRRGPDIQPHALTLMTRTRVRPDLRVGAAQQGVVPGRVHRRQFHRRHRRLRRNLRPLHAAPAAAASTTSSCRTAPSPAAEVQLLRRPRPQPFPNLLRIHRRIARRQVALAHQDGRCLVRPVPAASLNIHRHHNVRPQHAEEPRIVPHDLLPPPLPDHFPGIERVAIVDCPREILLGPIQPVRRQQLTGPQHRHIREQFRPDLVLASVPAIVLQVDCPQPHAVPEQSKQRVGLVIRMRGRLQEGAGHRQLSQRQPQRQRVRSPATPGNNSSGSAPPAGSPRRPTTQSQSDPSSLVCLRHVSCKHTPAKEPPGAIRVC